MPYEIEFMPPALEHLRRLTSRDRAMVLDRVEEQLRHQPDVPTRNRKRLRSNPLAPWELRAGELRIFYDVRPGPPAESGDREQAGWVEILAIGVKRGNRVWLGDEECEL